MAATRKIQCAGCSNALLVEPLATGAICPHCKVQLALRPAEGEKPLTGPLKAASLVGQVGCALWVGIFTLIVIAVIISAVVQSFH